MSEGGSLNPDVSVAPVVLTRGLRKTYGTAEARTEAVAGVDLAVSPGQFLCVMGPSGSGKSTLLHLLAGIETPTHGEVWVEGTRMDALGGDAAARFRRSRIGIVFQFFNLLGALSVEENVALPLLLQGRTLAGVEGAVADLLEFFGLERHAARLPGDLSGGEMQRVALARAMLVEPALVLADEPTGNLDSKSGESVLAHLRRMRDEHGTTVILVTHDVRGASYADRVVVMADGRIEDDLPNRAPESP